MRTETLNALLNAFLLAEFRVKLLIVFSLLLAFAMALFFGYKVIPKVMSPMLECVFKNFFKVIGREISLGIKNGSMVERADFVVLLICGGFALLALIGCLCANVTGRILLFIVIACMGLMAFIACVSVWLVVREGVRLKACNGVLEGA